MHRLCFWLIKILKEKAGKFVLSKKTKREDGDICVEESVICFLNLRHRRVKENSLRIRVFYRILLSTKFDEEVAQLKIVELVDVGGAHPKFFLVFDGEDTEKFFAGVFCALAVLKFVVVQRQLNLINLAPKGFEDGEKRGRRRGTYRLS